MRERQEERGARFCVLDVSDLAQCVPDARRLRHLDVGEDVDLGHPLERQFRVGGHVYRMLLVIMFFPVLCF